MAPYFEDHYADVSLPLEVEDQPGIRRGQFGAIHSLVGHLTLRKEPALVVMPTGTGKTGVLMLAPFLLRSQRVLIVTPSKLVRNQIATDFAELRTLKHIRAVPDDCEAPRVHEVLGTIRSPRDWEELEFEDVVVGTPNSCSPQYEEIPEPPPDLFDLVLIDEAHHFPAKTWAQLMDAFAGAKQGLFTATPFRRDRREIPGSLVFNYPLREARADGVFGDLYYYPITPGDDGNADAAIARAVEQRLQQDRASGYQHAAMIRASSKKRARALSTVYVENTQLQLEVVHSGLQDSTVQRVLQRLRDGSLDGVICVNMMGEGFDFPRLKVAGLHAPHQTLGVTLQFIGRFARVGDDNLGPASFFAVPYEIEGESKRLFKEDAIWSELIPELAQERVEREAETRRVLASLQDDAIHSTVAEGLSPYTLRPKFHAKVYSTGTAPDLSVPPTLPSSYEAVFHRASDTGYLSVTVAFTHSLQRWSDSLAVAATDFELVVIVYDPDSGLLFVCSSRALRSASAYEAIAHTYTEGAHHVLPLYKLGRILSGLDDVRCHNVGMRNRIHGSNTESYRIVAASRAERSLGPVDGRLFHQGHVDCSAVDQGSQVTLGYSSASKIWSKSGGSIAELVAWCRKLAGRMASDVTLRPIPGLEYLSVGQPLNRIPSGVFAVDWGPSAYDDNVSIVVEGEEQPFALPTLDLAIDYAESDDTSIVFSVRFEGQAERFQFRPGEGRLIESHGGDLQAVVCEGEIESSLLDFLNAEPPTFYFSDLATVRGVEYFPNTAGVDPLDDTQLLPLNWGDTDITVEFPETGLSDMTSRTIHEFMRDRLLGDPSVQVAIYDHRTGEMADFICIGETDTAINVDAYHCKASATSTPGSRVEDIYEVSGQVVKSLHYINDERRFISHVRRRTQAGSWFLKGDITDFNRLLAAGRRKPIEYRVIAVQPGISRSLLQPAHREVLAAASTYLKTTTTRDVLVLCSE